MISLWLVAKTIMLLFLALMIGIGVEGLWMVHKWGKYGEKGRG
jgi:hypothetical protein